MTSSQTRTLITSWKNCPTKEFARTPREILSFVSSVLGSTRFYLALCCSLKSMPLKLDWDDVVDEERLQVWTKFEQEARSLDELTFPRCYRRQKKTKEVTNNFQLPFRTVLRKQSAQSPSTGSCMKVKTWM